MVQVLLLIAGFILLIYGANLLVNSASALADSINIPKIVIGLTVVAFGTSAPELIVNVFAALQNSPSIAIGNVVGSNLINIMLILGASAVVYPLVVKSNTTWIEIPLCLFSAVLMLVLSNDYFLGTGINSQISRFEGIILMLFFVLFLLYSLHLARKGDETEDLGIKQMERPKAIIFILVGLVLLVAGGRMIVFSAVQMAENFGISQRIIALTIIAAGTSLPELATSVVAAVKKNTDIAIGNIVGSNIFNVFFILGTTAIIRPVILPPGANIDILLNIAVSLMLFMFVFIGRGRRIGRTEGAIFIALYIGYLGYLILW